MYKPLILGVLASVLLVSCGIPADEQEQGILFGSPKAPVEMIVYLDYQCPECKQFHDNILPALESAALSEGRLSLRLRDFPVIAGSNISHNAAWCAREIGTKEYRAFIGALYANIDAQRIFQLKEIGNSLGFPKSFAECVDTEKYANVVSTLKNKGRADNVVRTPTILLGKRRFNGASELFQVLEAVNEELAKTPQN